MSNCDTFLGLLIGSLAHLPTAIISLGLAALLASHRINKASKLAAERANNVIIWEKKLEAYQLVSKGMREVEAGLYGLEGDSSLEYQEKYHDKYSDEQEQGIHNIHQGSLFALLTQDAHITSKQFLHSIGKEIPRLEKIKCMTSLRRKLQIQAINDLNQYIHFENQWALRYTIPAG